MAQTFNVANYGITLFAGSAGNANTRAYITVTNGGSISAVISFMREGAAIPPNTDFNLYYPEHMLAPLVDMLRHETPVTYVSAGTQSCLKTGFEPVGEGEG